MAHHVEPMDIDSDFDNKENSLRHNNVLPFTEKGYEELDVSELNMKLRYSVTPASSPMSKSYTANCLDNRSLEPGEDSLNITINENANLTRSLNSTITKNDNVVKSLKALPLQAIPTEQCGDSVRNISVLRALESTVIPDNGNITVTVSAPSDIDENLSLPSSSSSTVHTPEATTPTKDIPVKDGGSPIMRGLKSVLSMFRSSQSPIPPVDHENNVKPDVLSPVEKQVSAEESKPQAVISSTPIAAHRKKEMSPTKRSSPQKDHSVVFNEGLEKELQWKDETTIIFSQERIPIHKLMLQQPQDSKNINKDVTEMPVEEFKDLNSTVEYMDISYNDSIKEKTLTEIDDKQTNSTVGGESDSEFVDCETTFTKNESDIIEDNDKTPVADNGQELDLTKEMENDISTIGEQMVLYTTQDILDATFSDPPTVLLPDDLDTTKTNTVLPEGIEISTKENDYKESHNTSQIENLIYDETVETSDALPSQTTIADLDTTMTPIDASTTEAIDQTFDIRSSDITNVKLQQESLDTTKTKVDNLEVTHTKALNVTENLDIALTNETITLDNKTFDVQSASVTDKVDELKESLQSDSITSDEIPVALIDTPASVAEATKEPILNHLAVDTVKEALITELPVDVPLPDEDDIDKEFNMSVDIKPELNTTAVNLPVDLVDDIKIMPEITETVNTIPTEEAVVPLTEEINNEVEKSHLNDSENNIDNKTIELNSIEKATEASNTLEQINDILDPCKEIENIIPTSELLSSTILINDNESAADVRVENTELKDIEISIIENEGVANIPEETEQQKDLTYNKCVLPMDINESVSEFKPLPDIINQTVSTIDNVESNVAVTKPVLSDAVVKEEANINDEIAAVPITEVEIPITSADHLISLGETNKGVEELQLNESASDADGTVIEHSPLEMTLNHNSSNNNIPITDIVTNITKTEATLPTHLSTINAIGKEDEAIEIKDQVTENTTAVEEEILLSENNSPYVSVIADNVHEYKPDVDIDGDKDSIKTTKTVLTPPSSPPIRSKGYNFNFDDMDFDPFATKTNIRMSPPLDTINKSDEINVEAKSVEKRMPKKDYNRRKSQPERKKPTAPKRKFNTTIDVAMDDKQVELPVEKPVHSPVVDIQLDSPVTVALNPSNVTIEENTLIKKTEIMKSNSEISLKDKDDLEKANESSIDSNLNELKATSSSEQSTYYSAGTSSSDSIIVTKNVFNLPEIDDMNFNPFATKSKMRQSPPLDVGMDDPFVTKSKVMCSPVTSMVIPQGGEAKTTSFEDKVENEPMEKDASSDLSNTTASSKAIDEKNVTTKEVNTEDEDTIEGPFLESDDLHTDDKLSDFDGENIDMMQFNELPTQSNEENLDNGELFIDAEAFEFLLNQNKSNTVVDSGKESLFLKFDPLFAKRMSAVSSDSVVASLAKLQRKQSTPTKATPTPPKNLPSPIAGPSNLNVTQDMDMNNSEEFNEDLNITVSKPMMVVPPAVNPVTPRNKSLTPNRSNRRSITFTSPAMAVIDRLLSLSNNNSMVHDTTVTQVSREQNEADIALSQLRELLAEKEISVYNLRSESHELRDRLSTLESHVKNLENESEGRLKKINQLTDTLAEKTKVNRSMAAVVEEYERTIASLIAETAQDKKRHAEARIQLIHERDEQTAHLTSMEVSFSDLHSKYEKSKQVILNCKANEEAYKKSIKDFEENFTKMQNNYELLKQHATSKLNHANQEMEKINRIHEAEVLKLNAMIKRKDLHITSLEESLIQKTKANEELTAICDELISKVG